MSRYTYQQNKNWLTRIWIHSFWQCHPDSNVGVTQLVTLVPHADENCPQSEQPKHNDWSQVNVPYFFLSFVKEFKSLGKMWQANGMISLSDVLILDLMQNVKRNHPIYFEAI